MSANDSVFAVRGSFSFFKCKTLHCLERIFVHCNLWSRALVTFSCVCLHTPTTSVWPASVWRTWRWSAQTTSKTVVMGEIVGKEVKWSFPLLPAPFFGRWALPGCTAVILSLLLGGVLFHATLCCSFSQVISRPKHHYYYYPNSSWLWVFVCGSSSNTVALKAP